MSENSSLKNFSFVTLSRIITAGLYSGFYLIFATILEPETFGQMSYLIAIAGTASIISRFGFPLSVVVYRAKENHDLSNQLNVLSVITTSAAALILLPIDINAALLCFALSTFLMNTHNLLGFKKYKKYFWASVYRSVSTIALPIVLYFAFDIPGILLGLGLSNLLGSIDFFKKLSFKINAFREVRSHKTVLMNNFGVEASSALSRWVDKLLIFPLYGFAFVGLYQFNMQILIILMILPTSLYSFMLSEKSSGRKHKRIVKYILLITIIFVVTVLIFSPYVIEQLFPKYLNGISALQILIISVIPLAITQILKADLQAKESTKVGYAGIARILSLLGFIAVLGNIYGLEGLSIAVLVSVTIETLFFFWLYRASTAKSSENIPTSHD